MAVARDRDAGRLLRDIASAVTNDESAKGHLVTVDRDDTAAAAAVDDGTGLADHREWTVNDDRAGMDTGGDDERAATRRGVDTSLEEARARRRRRCGRHDGEHE